MKTLFASAGAITKRLTIQTGFFAALLLTVAALGVEALGGTSPGVNGSTDGFYFGRIAFEDDVIGIALKARHVRVFVTDAEPGGDAEWFEGALKGLSIDLRSTSRRARLRATIDPLLHVWNGTIDMPNGTTRAVAAAGTSLRSPAGRDVRGWNSNRE